MASDGEVVDCTGVIFQFNAEAILFEFSVESDSEIQIGMVKPSNLRVGEKCIPGNVKKMETLSRYMEVGDELTCSVKRMSDMKKLTYQEEDEDGEMSEVEIQPGWLTESAIKIVTSDSNQDNDIGELENPFYSDSQPSPGDDNIDNSVDDNVEQVLPDTVSCANNKEETGKSAPPNTSDPKAILLKVQNQIAKACGASKKVETAQTVSVDEDEDMLELEVDQTEFQELEDIAETVKDSKENERKRKHSGDDNQNSVFKLPAPVQSKKANNISLSKSSSDSQENNRSSDKEKDIIVIDDISNIQEKENNAENRTEPTFGAKLVQFRKSSNVKNKGKVTTGIMELVDGEHKGKKALFQASNCYVFGHHLGQSNLMYNLHMGDQWKVTVTPKAGPNEDVDIPLIIKKAWLGPATDSPIDAGDSVGFKAWLLERSLQEDAFSKWIKDELDPKPFFPLKSELLDAKVIMLIRDDPKCDGALVRVTKEGSMKDNLVVFERDDFYICGVHIGDADMRFLLRPGDQVTVQAMELTERLKKSKIKKYSKLDEFEFNHTSLLAYVGDVRPRGPNMKPEASPELKRFLDGKGMSLKEFTDMRSSPVPQSKETKQKKQPQKTAPSSIPSLMGAQPTYMGLHTALVTGSVPSFPPPSFPTSIPPPVIVPSVLHVQNIGRVQQFSALAAKAAMVKGSNVGELLKTEDDVDHAFTMAKLFTEALLKMVQGKLRDKIMAKVGRSASEVLGSLSRQQEMAVEQLNKAKIVEKVAKSANAKPMSQAMISAMANLPPPVIPVALDPLAQYEKQAKEFNLVEDKNKGLVAMSDMKKRLDAFKAAKQVEAKISNLKKVKKSKPVKEDAIEVIEVNDNKNYQWKINKEMIEEQAMSPLELLRKYTISKLKIEERGDKVHFREISFPKSCRTNMKINKTSELTGGVKEFYSLSCLVHFVRNMSVDHPEYVRRCITEDIKCVRRTDRESVEQYLTGKRAIVLNLENISHRDLNPDLFGGSEFSSSSTLMTRTGVDPNVDNEYGGQRFGGINNVIVSNRSSGSKSPDKYDPFRPTSPNHALQVPRPPSFPVENPFDNRASSSERQSRFDRGRASSGEKQSRFDQRPPDAYDQRSSKSSEILERRQPIVNSISNNEFGQKSNNSFDQRSSMTLDQRSNSSFDQRSNKGFDQWPNQTHDQRSNNTMDLRPNVTMDQRSNIALDQTTNNALDQPSNNDLDQRSSSSLDQRSSNSSFDQRSTSSFDRRSNLRFDPSPNNRFDEGANNRFDTQSSNNQFDQRPVDSFDQRPVDSFDQRPVDSFDQRPSNMYDQRPQNSFDQRPDIFNQRSTNNIYEEDQQPPTKRSRFGQTEDNFDDERFVSNNQSRFGFSDDNQPHDNDYSASDMGNMASRFGFNMRNQNNESRAQEGKGNGVLGPMFTIGKS